jgi:hypothetical protein
LPALAALVSVVSDGDVGQDVGVSVEPRVNKTKRSLTSVEELIVDQREDTSKGGGASTGATNTDGLTTIDNNESPSESSDIRSTTALGVVGGGRRVEGGGLALVEVALDGVGLVRSGGLSPVKSTTRAEGSDGSLGGANSVLEGGGTNGRDVGGSSRVGRRELGAKLATRTRITRGDQDCEAKSAHLLELGIELSLVGGGRLLGEALVSIGDRVNERGVLLRENSVGVGDEILPEVEVGVRVEGGLGSSTNTGDVLDVKRGFDSRLDRRVGTNNSQSGDRSPGDRLFGPELRKISRRVELALELSNGLSGLGIGGNEGVGDVVDLTEIGGANGPGVSKLNGGGGGLTGNEGETSNTSNEVDVFSELRRNGVRTIAGNGALASLMLKSPELGLKKSFGSSDGGLEGHEITGQGHLGILNSVGREPCRNGVDRLIGRGNKISELFHGQVLVEEFITRGGNGPEELVKRLKVTVLESNSEGNNGIRTGGTNPVPVARSVNGRTMFEVRSLRSNS